MRGSACIEGVAATRRTKAAVSVAVRTTTGETGLALVLGLRTIGEQILLDCVRDGFGARDQCRLLIWWSPKKESTRGMQFPPWSARVHERPL
jgi:hypothetical protein